MLQDLPPEIGWDIRSIEYHPPASQEVYVLFLFAVSIVTLVKLLRVWGKALPFRLPRQMVNTSYLAYLHALANSLSQWIALTYLGLGVYVAIDLYNAFGRIAYEKTMGASAAFGALQELAGVFTMTLVVILFAFLVRWHVVNRIARLQSLAS